jgi:hypothetical protein
VAVEAATCSEDIYPGELPWGSARTCRVAPIHFRPPIAGPVLSPHVRASLPSHVGPQQQDQSACSQESCLPGGPPWGQHVPGVRPPSTFGRILLPGYEFSPHARAGPKAAVVDDEGVGFPGELFRPSRCYPPPRSSPRGPWSLYLCPRPV